MFEVPCKCGCHRTVIVETKNSRQLAEPCKRQARRDSEAAHRARAAAGEIEDDNAAIEVLDGLYPKPVVSEIRLPL